MGEMKSLDTPLLAGAMKKLLERVMPAATFRLAAVPAALPVLEKTHFVEKTLRSAGSRLSQPSIFLSRKERKERIVFKTLRTLRTSREISSAAGTATNQAEPFLFGAPQF
ncbi:MAG: hypothetical protein IJG38_00790 [Thermoguttaceae bacterium]|nr:hypothetical protein [Thermoguttaceae bacterium]